MNRHDSVRGESVSSFFSFSTLSVSGAQRARGLGRSGGFFGAIYLNRGMISEVETRPWVAASRSRLLYSRAGEIGTPGRGVIRSVVVMAPLLSLFGEKLVLA